MSEPSLGELMEGLFAGWTPPVLGEAALKWLLSRLNHDTFFFLVRLAVEQPEGRSALSGFRIGEDAIRRQALRETLEARLIGVLLRNEIARAGLFFLSFPDAPWYRWADTLAAYDETWLLENWRALLRATADPALAVGMMLDERPAVAARGERLVRTVLIWSGRLRPDPGGLPEAVQHLQGLFVDGAPEASASPPLPEQGEVVSAAGPEPRPREARRAEAQRRKAEERLEARRAKLKSELADREEELRKAKSVIRVLERQVSGLEAGRSAEIETRIAEVYEELCGGDAGLRAIWEDALAGRTTSALEQVEAALETQARLDQRYGTRSAVRRRLDEMEDRLKAVEQALADAIVPARQLVRARRVLLGEISHWREVLPAKERPESPLAACVLAAARSLPVNQEGLAGLEGLLKEIDRPPLTGLLDVEVRDAVRPRLIELLAERRNLWHGREIAGRPPVRTEDHRVVEIADLAAFVLRHKDVCLRGTVLVDGYNVIKSSAEWAVLDRQDFRRTRGQFCDLWQRRSGDWQRVEVVFDGQDDHMQVEERGNLTIVFTDARASSQRADLYIAARLEELHQREPAGIRFLVTADQGLRTGVIKWCSYFIEPRWALIRYLAAGG